MKSPAGRWLVAVVWLAMAVEARAQSAGSITGTVKDTSGGALPGASVTAANPAQAVTQTARTDEGGVFVFPQLPPGTYSVRVELNGFKSVERTGVILSTKAAVNVGDVLLEVGNMAEAITVEANVGRLQVQTESGERSDLVTNKQLRDVALNGRNIADLFKTIPGVIAGATQTTSTVQNVVGSFNINGTRANQHEYTVDGVTNLNLGNNTGALVSVNPDALEEVKVLTSNYQAEYGRAGGGFIALTTRGGTNEYRGGGRYFKRHESQNANNFFNNASARPRPFYRFDYYGWDLGGPVPFLGSKGSRKVFFFLAQEYYDQTTPATNPTRIRVPTEAERRGDFSQTLDGNGRLVVIRDPLTGQPFPGNVIPAGRFAPGMQALMGIYPLPNAPEGGALYNFTSQPPRDIPRREDVIRVDWQIAAGTRLSARYIHNKDEDVQPLGTTTAAFNFPLASSSIVRRNGPGDLASATLTHAFSPILVNEFTYGLGMGGVFIGPVDLGEVRRSALGVTTPLLFPDADPEGVIPSVRFLGIANQTCPATGVANCATAVTDFNGTPFDQKFKVHNFANNTTRIMGAHTVKGGVYYQRANNRRTSFGPVQSNLVFGDSHPQATGHPFANALLGLFDTYTQAEQKITSNYFYQDLSAYLQDTWKVRDRLTLDLGLRVSYYEPIHDREDRLGFFNPDLFDPARAVRLYRPVCVGLPCTGANVRAIDPAVTATPTVQNTRPANYVATIVPGSGDLTNGIGRVADGYPAGGFETPSLLWGPRLGFAWDVGGDHKTVVRGGFGVSYDRIDTDRIADAITNPPGIQVATLSNGSLTDLASAGRSDLLPVQGDVVGYRREQKVPTVYSFSLGVQRDLGAGIVADLAYVGTRSRNNPRQTDLNAIPYGTMFQRSAQNPAAFGGVVPAAEPNLPQVYREAGLGFTGQNALNPNLLRPFPGYGAMRFRSFDSRADYNALQAALQRRFSKGFTFGISYTLSRARTDAATPTDATHPSDPMAYDYALANFDRTHYFVANYVWNLPKGAGLLGGGRVARALLDNWTLSGISWIASGNPVELTLSIAGVNAAQRLLGTDAGGTSGGLQPRFRVNGDPTNGDGTINPAAFSVPRPGDFGPYDRLYLRNPGINNHDLSVFKNFPIGGGGRRMLQLRLEMFNVLNHTQFSARNLTTNVTNGTGQTGAAIFNNYAGLVATGNTRPAGDSRQLGTFFGEPNAARDPRIIQLGLKLYF
jgi:outer membrane receptor protein involved in Fe transport